MIELWLCTDSSAEAYGVERALKRLQLRIYPDIIALSGAYLAYSQMYEQCKAEQIYACNQYSKMHLAVQVWPSQPQSPAPHLDGPSPTGNPGKMTLHRQHPIGCPVNMTWRHQAWRHVRFGLCCCCRRGMLQRTWGSSWRSLGTRWSRAGMRFWKHIGSCWIWRIAPLQGYEPRIRG